MVNIILDGNILIRYPKLLATRNPDIKLLLTSEVIAEMANQAFLKKVFSDRMQLIELASKEKLIEIVPTGEYGRDAVAYPEGSSVAGDVSIVNTAAFIKTKNMDVKVATLDKELTSILGALGIDVLLQKEIEELVASFGIPISAAKSRLIGAARLVLRLMYARYLWLLPKSLTKQVEARLESIEAQIILFEDKELFKIIRQSLLGVLVILFGIVVVNNIQDIVYTIPIWGTITLIVLLGITLFFLREKQRLAYGIAEFVVGILAIIVLFRPNHFQYKAITFNMDFLVKLLGGLYIMVRGQDNIVKSLQGTKPGAYLKEKWGLGS